MVSLPKNLDDLNRMFLNIDIQLIDWVEGISESKKGIFGLRTKTVRINEVVNNSEYYTFKTKYRKTLHLGSYNEKTLLLIPFREANGID